MYLNFTIVFAESSDSDYAILDEIHSICGVTLPDYLLAIGIMFRYKGIR